VYKGEGVSTRKPQVQNRPESARTRPMDIPVPVGKAPGLAIPPIPTAPEASGPVAGAAS
jgi:hypothetical protein